MSSVRPNPRFFESESSLDSVESESTFLLHFAYLSTEENVSVILVWVDETQLALLPQSEGTGDDDVNSCDDNEYIADCLTFINTAASSNFFFSFDATECSFGCFVHKCFHNGLVVLSLPTRIVSEQRPILHLAKSGSAVVSKYSHTWDFFHAIFNSWLARWFAGFGKTQKQKQEGMTAPIRIRP